jgi:hypothetical protein
MSEITSILDFSFEGENNGHQPEHSATSRDLSLSADSSILSGFEKFKRENPQELVVEEEQKYSVGAVPSFCTYDEFVSVVAVIYQLYTANRRLPTYVEASQLTYVGPGMIKRITETAEFKSAITARGVPWDDFHGLSSTQMLVAQIVTNPTDRRDLRRKLRSAGVTYPQYRAWMAQPAFSQYMNRITEGMLTDHIPDFNTVLTNKALAGDLHSIKYINELSGRHDPNRQQVLDLQAVVQNLLDIITRNVKDPEVMQAIAAEFSLAMGSKSAIGQQTIRGEVQ